MFFEIKYKKISELIDKDCILIGYPLNRIKVDENYNDILFECHYLKTTSIEEGLINCDKLEKIEMGLDGKENFLMGNGKFNKYLTKQGDVIIQTSTPYDACIINKHCDILISSYFIVIRKYNYPYFLTYYLNSDKCKQKLQALATGSSSKMLNKNVVIAAIKDIDNKYDESTLEKIDNMYKNYLKQIESINNIKRKEKQYIDSYLDEMERREY